MLPVTLNPDFVSVGLAGRGEGLARRAALLADAGIYPASISVQAPTLGGLHVLFVAGLPPKEAARLARLARDAGILVNVEDVPQLCDFHIPAIIRRGDLLLTVSTGGKSPGLARLIREWLQKRLGLEWIGRLQDVSRARDDWRKQGHAPDEVSHRTKNYVAERDWLA